MSRVIRDIRTNDEIAITKNRHKRSVETREVDEDDEILQQSDTKRTRLAEHGKGPVPTSSEGGDKNVDHTHVVANHYNALMEKGISERKLSRILHMRNFNNWIKSMLISEYLDKIKQSKSPMGHIRVLDMCCGKGGDLLKWANGDLTHLICADIADVSVEQCRTRYEQHKVGRLVGTRPFSAEFLAHDCTKVRLRDKYKDPRTQLSLVSCQFAFHYSFESQSQAECMFRNASENLRPGGFFIGTIPNANVLVSRWKKTDGNIFGNDIYSVDFQCDENRIPLFGAKYNFHLDGVVDCPEFLVHLPTFSKLAWKFGLQLVTFKSFPEFYKNNVSKAEGKSLLIKMQALAPYPPNDASSSDSAGASREYSHAIEYLQHSKGHDTIGTLSQSEWEVISLYSVFAFQKARKTWTAEGKPEFIKYRT